MCGVLDGFEVVWCVLGWFGVSPRSLKYCIYVATCNVIVRLAKSIPK